MSHTSGFEDLIIGLFTKDESELKTLYDVIYDNVPKRIRPSGKEISYSNYGASLAGFIVENETGISFEQYIENNIFVPLKMNNSTFIQPVPDSLKDDLAIGYMLVNNEFLEQDFEFIQGTPAGGISTTANDMARFLMTNLNNGILDGNQILNTETIQQMHTALFMPDPNSGGLAYGLIEKEINGVKILGHSGDTIYFHSNFAFLPDYDLGIFISTNTSTGMLPLHNLFEHFIKSFFPAPTGLDIAISNTRPLEDYTGSYISNRRSESDFTKLFSLFMKFEVRLSEDDLGLDILDLFTQKFNKYLEIDERTFQREDGTDRFVFLADMDNNINAVMSNSFPVITFTRMSAIENPLLIITITILDLIMIVSGIIVRPIGLLAMLSKKHKFTGAEKWIGFAGSVLILFYLAFITSMIASFSGDVVFEIPNPIPFIILGITFFINIANIPCCILAWKNNYWKLPSRLYYTFAITISSVFLWLLYYWEILFPG